MSELRLKKLAKQLEGEFYSDETMRRLYATDASAYREMPLAVALPKHKSDLKTLINFAQEHSVSLIPRTAGTSLAGQVVGQGIIVDVSKYFNEILEVNKKEGWVRVQPGVVRDDLNRHLAEYGLFFGPETSTANRAMVGGMVGNNSCGANSIVYGSTRDHLLEAEAFLADGALTNFKALSETEFRAKCAGGAEQSDYETNIYRTIEEVLDNENNRASIEAEFPKPNIKRRNTGYAIDLLARAKPFHPDGEDINLCTLIAGSEGTLAFLTELKLHCDPTPPPHHALVCIHCDTIHESLLANLVALQYGPSASELIDKFILDCTKENIEQRKNRFFIKGDPGAILVVEIARDDEEERDLQIQMLIAHLKKENLGNHYPILMGADIPKIWGLRKAGLGLLSNIPGDAKPAPVIEDTAVDVDDLPEYIREFNLTLGKYGLHCVHYAHAGSGEIHLRPILDLKTEEGTRLFRVVAEEIAALVKKYRGSLSGEHGDGRLRGEFIKFMVGDHNYSLLRQIKESWDPQNIFNPGKIIDTPPMDTSLRYTAGQETPEIKTYYDWSRFNGVVRAAEQCNGSGDCRKSALSGGTMCPSYMATGNEKETTRARANILREMLNQPDQVNRFAREEIKEVMDLCLSCKGCKSECPSNVDMAKLKGEFQQQYYDVHGVPRRAKLISNYTKSNKLASIAPWFYNVFVTNPLTAAVFKKYAGFASQRSLPKLYHTTLRSWYNKKFTPKTYEDQRKSSVYFFCDEFTNFNDTEIGIQAIKLLDHLNYKVHMPVHAESGRTYLSKGLLKEARDIIDDNIRLFSSHISENTPLVGLEPSAILSFRDEYPDLCSPSLKDAAIALSKHVYTIEEFLAMEADRGMIQSRHFNKEKQLVKVHGHCHQKAISSMTPTKKILSLPENYEVHMIASGCCGMAGSFGYEEEHFDLSMKIGELVLFPAVRSFNADTIVAAAGTSCRHQIKDGTGRKALHPVEVLYNALR
ncbi:MAG: FAD-linked oxidase C-terminal domain-containing protein [Cyclobacteriaceae bacterium]